MTFDYAALRRYPDVEAPNLQAWDATDELLGAYALDAGVPGAEIAVIGDEYGAITLALADAGLDGVRVHQDLATGRRALARNASAIGVAAYTSHELDASLLSGATLVLLQLPKSLAELEQITDAVARWARPDVVLVAGGRVKHMALAQNDVLARFFAKVQPQRAARKSRLVIASEARPVPAALPFPVRSAHAEYGLTLASHGGAFAGSRIDIGTRVMLDVLAGRVPRIASENPDRADAARRAAPEHAAARRVDLSFAAGPGAVAVDLGCGTGALAASFALAHPQWRVIATDRSAAAAASARETMRANGLDARVTVMHDDAASEIADGSADVVLLNPPFHLGASVHTGAATRLFEAAARVLRPGGQLLTVFNSGLGYRSELTRLVGQTEQLARTSKFTVTRSVKR